MARSQGRARLNPLQRHSTAIAPPCCAVYHRKLAATEQLRLLHVVVDVHAFVARPGETGGTVGGRHGQRHGRVGTCGLLEAFGGEGQSTASKKRTNFLGRPFRCSLVPARRRRRPRCLPSSGWPSAARRDQAPSPPPAAPRASARTSNAPSMYVPPRWPSRMAAGASRWRERATLLVHLVVMIDVRAAEEVHDRCRCETSWLHLVGGSERVLQEGHDRVDVEEAGSLRVVLVKKASRSTSSATRACGEQQCLGQRW